MVKARGLDPTDKYWAAYIQSACAEEARSPAAQRKGLGARHRLALPRRGAERGGGAHG